MRLGVESNRSQVVAVIPARGGSKGIPRKNIVDVCGKPLVAYSIEAALKSESIDLVIVSTDDREIADISIQYGAQVPFLRPADIAKDESNPGDAVDYTLDRLSREGICPQVCVTMFPPHLFRNPRMINSLVKKSLEGYKSVRTVKRIDVKSGPMMLMDEVSRALKPMTMGGPYADMRELNYFRAYGSLSIWNMGYPLPYNFYLHELTDPITLIDIDAYEDLALARKIIDRNLFNFDLT